MFLSISITSSACASRSSLPEVEEMQKRVSSIDVLHAVIRKERAREAKVRADVVHSTPSLIAIKDDCLGEKEEKSSKRKRGEDLFDTKSADAENKFTESLENAKILAKQSVKKIDDNTYSVTLEEEKGGYTLVYEKLTEETVEFWRWMQSSQFRWANYLTNNYQDPRFNFYVGCMGGLTGFGHVLNQFNKTDVWISYVCTKAITTSRKTVHKEGFNAAKTIVKSENGEAGIDNIEMLIGTVTSGDVPFYTHMGITRSLYRTFHNLEPKHSNISEILHAFSAFMQEHLNPDSHKPYMMSQALKHMRHLMLKKYPEHSHVGDNKFFDQLQKRINEVNLPKEEAEKLKLEMQNHKKHPPVIHVEDTRFNLLKDGDVIWSIDRAKGHWFFDVADTSISGDPFVVIQRDAMINSYLKALY